MQNRVCELIRMKPPALTAGLLSASGTTVPIDATRGYKTGCIFQQTDGGAGTALYVNEGSVTSCAFKSLTPSGAGKMSYGVNDWGVGATGVLLNGTDPDMVLQAIGRINSTLAAGAYSAGYNQLAITEDQTANVSAFGSWNELYLTGCDLSGGTNFSGCWGHVEISGTVVGPSNPAYRIAGVTATIIAPSTLTNSALLAGVVACSTITSGITNNGIVAAYAVQTDAGKMPWQVGLYVPVGSASIGIRIGNWVTAGGVGGAIAFSSAQNFNSDGQLGVVSCFGESTSNLTNAYQAHVGRYRHLVSGSSTTIAHETYGLVGQLVGKSVTLTHLHAGLLGTLEANTTAVVSNGAYAYSVAAVMGRIGGGALITATKPVASFSAILNGAAISASGKAFAYAACGTSTGTFHALLAADKCDRLLYAATGSAYECGVKVGSITTIPDTTASGAIKIMVDSTEYYIPFHAAGSISGI